ncbi:MAG TPA: hypothetical protein VF763_05375, partial [Candidatus Limnocylindrales bacterium]
GDRVALYEGPAGTWAVAIVTAWSDGGSAARFQQAAVAAAAKLPEARVVAGTAGPIVLVASDPATLQALAGASFQAGP